VEIDLVAVGALGDATILLGKEPCDPRAVRAPPVACVSASLANVVFEYPAGGIESVVDRDVGWCGLSNHRSTMRAG
jgi:hypothetical protein